MDGRGHQGVLAAAERRPAAHVLLVEDSGISRLVTRAILEKARFRVEIAENGLEAVSALRQGRMFDIILMDLDMPVMDGFEATAAIRALGRARGGDTPILALSTHGLEDPRRAAVDGYLAKPYAPPRLIDEVTRTLRQRCDGLDPDARGLDPDDAAPVWDAERYRDLCGRLGAGKVARHLASVADHCRIVMGKLVSDPEDAVVLAWEAHSLISPAGLFGFEDLVAACRQAQVVGTTTSCRAQSLALVAAIGRVLVAIPAEPRSE